MIKKTITYTDFDGAQRTEDFYFNLTKAEAMELELSYEGGISKAINNIMDTSKDVEENVKTFSAKESKFILEMFKDIILRAYGEKSVDGRRFVKTQEMRDSFSATEAYSELLIELTTDGNAAEAFVNGIIPKTA